MPYPRHPPRWLSRSMVAPLQSSLPREQHEALVRRVLEAPPAMCRRTKDVDLATLAAKYVSAFSSNHGFMRGSKVAALMAAYVFLGLNGYDLDASEAEIVSLVDSTADRELSEEQVADWISEVMMRTTA